MPDAQARRQLVPREQGCEEHGDQRAVQLHNDAQALTQRLSQQDVVMYLHFIHHYTSVFVEKRQKLEEQQLHLNIGLDKLRQTAEQVAEMQESLGAKDAELKQKDAQANLKLQEMVEKQNEAEGKKGDAIVLSTFSRPG